MPFIKDFIIGPLIGVALSILMAACRKAYIFFKEKPPVKFFWGEFLKSPVSIIIPAGPKEPKTKEDFKRLYLNERLFDMKTASRIFSFLSSLNEEPDKIDIFEATYSGNFLEENIILIGGASSNKITEKMMEKIGNPIYFKEFKCKDTMNSQNKLIDKHSKKEYITIKKNGNIEKDCAFILRTINPYNDKKAMLIIAGVHGPAAYPAATALTDHDFLREIKKKSKSNSICIITESDTINKIPQKPDIKSVYTFKLKS